MGSVYLVGSKELKWYKIGYSVKDDPRERIKTVSKGVPFSLELVHFWVTSFHPEKLEAFLHQCFTGKQLKGEWFRFDDSDIAFCREQAADFLKDPSKHVLTKRLMRQTTNGRHWSWPVKARQARSESMKGKPVAGFTMKGRSHSKKTKDKMSETHIDFYTNNPSAVAALNAARPRGFDHAWFGKERPKSTRDAISKSLEGKVQSEATKHKRSESLKAFYAKKAENSSITLQETQ